MKQSPSSKSELLYTLQEKQQKEINELKQQLDSALANSSHAETSAKQELSQAKRQATCRPSILPP